MSDYYYETDVGYSAGIWKNPVAQIEHNRPSWTIIIADESKRPRLNYESANMWAINPQLVDSYTITHTIQLYSARVVKHEVWGEVDQVMVSVGVHSLT